MGRKHYLKRFLVQVCLKSELCDAGLKYIQKIWTFSRIFQNLMPTQLLMTNQSEIELLSNSNT